MKIELTEEQKSLEKKLVYFYGNAISVHWTTSENNVIKLDIGKVNKNVDLVVHIHCKRNIALIWNIQYRRNGQWEGKNLSINKAWRELKYEPMKIVSIYKCFRVKDGQYHEKVLVLDLDTLSRATVHLVDLLEFDKEDKQESQSILKDKHNSSKDINESRNRITTSKWNRAQDFRWKVLENYGNECAICRCGAINLLQAAHIKAVFLGGSDDKENGICLCANHHLMLDSGLVKINYDSLELSYVSDIVSQMPWYKEFLEKYQGKLKKPNQQKTNERR